MKIFIVDECNSAWDEKLDFFLYGGIVVDESDAKPLAEKLLQIKKDAGVKKERPIKWTNNKWKKEGTLEEESHARIKDKIIKLVSSSNCKIIVCLSPQGFYHSLKQKEGKIKQVIDANTQKRTYEYGLNDALTQFDWFLRETESLGIVFADKFDDSVKNHMHEHCFKIFPNGTHTSLKRIIFPVIQIENEYSHLHQINDVILGAIYFSLREMEYNFLPLMRDSFWQEEGTGILGRGFTIFPKVPKVTSLLQSTRNLKKKFERLITTV